MKQERSLNFIRSRVWARLRSIGEAKLSSLPRILLIFACFITITIAPILRMNQAPNDARPYWVFFLSHAWYLFLAAIILRFEDKFKKRSTIEKSRRHAWEVRKSKAAQVVSQLQLKAPKTSKRSFRTAVLECVATSVAELLNRPPESIHANLLDFSTGDRDRMAVVARTDLRRHLPQTYPVTDDFGPVMAIRRSIAWIEDDVKDDPRWQDLGRRSYRSIISIPVTQGGAAFGALTIDCTEPYAFVHSKLDIAYQVQPYIALLALTYDADSLYLSCGYGPSRIP